MGKYLHIIAFFAVATFIMASCSTTRHVPSSSYLLKSNELDVDRSMPKNERITQEDIESYIQQTPASKFLGTNVMQWVYNWATPGSRTWWSRSLRRIGTGPVILDTVAVAMSAKYIGKYVSSKGYFDSHTTYTIDTSSPKKAKVVYSIKQGEAYRIRDIKYEFRDANMQELILRDTSSSLIRRGVPLDEALLDKERRRIKDYLQYRGYYAFTVNNIGYVADTTIGGHLLDLTMVIRKSVVDYTSSGEAVLADNARYRIDRVYIHPDQGSAQAAAGTAGRDTLSYEGLNIVYGGDLKIRKEVLRRVVCLSTDDLYSAREVTRAYSNLMNLGYYKSARIVFTESTREPILRFEADSTQRTENFLDCNIYCTPSVRQSFNIGVENTFTSDYYGISGTVGYHNRNLFRGAEGLDVSFTGSYDFIKAESEGRKGSFEVGVTTSITLPRFVLPLRMSRLQRTLDRVANPKTKFEMSVNNQRRPYYHRVLSNVNWGYYWAGNRFTMFSLRPIDISVVKVNYLSEEFKEKLNNPYLIQSYESQIIGGMSGSWVYNNAARRSHGTSIGARLNWETAGNLLYGMEKLFGSPVKDGDQEYYKIFGERFAQYARLDMTFTNGINYGKFNFVYRAYAGIALAYGNNNVIPYDRQFYAGGGNSMRGWVARTLGPGGQAKVDDPGAYPQQTGNMRLEANVEARFPIWSLFKGALFCDAGNVWNVGGGNDYDPESVFRPKTFYKQFGLNVGVGLRLDISMTVVRLDWGIRMHDPNLPEGQRWIHGFAFDNTTLSLAVGYPF